MKRVVRLIAALLVVPFIAAAQFPIEGVSDRTVYNDTVQLRIPVQEGFGYSASLNYSNIPVGAFITVNKPDFYELRASQTNLTDGTVSNRYIRFIVADSSRGGTEWGLPTHTPFPVIQSSSNEFAGAHLRLLFPASFPAGYPLPLVAWVVDENDQAIRANGILHRDGSALFQMRRGVGSGFVPYTTGENGALDLSLSVQGVATNVSLTIESNVTWTTVSGLLAGDTTWPANSRIHVTGNITVPSGAKLEIGEGTVIRLNNRVDITNNGTINILGAVANPVVFMSAVTGQPWGGFISKTTSGTINGTGVIFTGAGAVPNWFGANGNPGSHRVEQALFYLDGGQQLTLTDSAAIYMPGQFGHSRAANANTRITLTRFLLQHCPTGGEFTGANFLVNDSAFIEFPDDSPEYEDGDNDALYIVDGSHYFTNTLFGWTKDDGIDSGASGYGPLTYQSCWFEAAFHEGNSLSGYKDVLARDTVYFDCGQGIEDGYNAPTGLVVNCFFSMNKAGIRHGDNYPSIGNYDGRFTATNCISIYNHRDLFGFNWRSSGGWTNSYDRFFVSNNFVSALDTNYPNNTLWNPDQDGWRLAAFGGRGHVGIGFGVRPGPMSLSQFPDGIPVGLSIFATNEVRVDFSVDATDGTHRTGTLVFPAGLTRSYIPVPTNLNGVLRIALLNPVNGDITSQSSLLIQNLAPPSSSATVLSPLAATWQYLDDGTDQGTAWRALAFDDASWSNGVARLGFGGDASATTLLRRFVQQNGTNTSRQVTNFYFRRTFVVENPADFESIQIRYQRDDGCIVYLNGTEMFRNNMPGVAVTANTFASSTISGATDLLRFHTNLISAASLLEGTNVIAVQVHQSTATSSDIAWECEVRGLPAPAQPRLELSPFGSEAVLYWIDAAYRLEETDEVTGPWRWASNTNSPVPMPLQGTRFFRLRK